MIFLSFFFSKMSSGDQSVTPVGSNQAPQEPIDNEMIESHESQPIHVEDEEIQEGSSSPNKQGLKSRAWDHIFTVVHVT